MKKVKVSFDAFIQLFGMLGVLGGLIFVGLEMQQTQTIAMAGQTQARNQSQLDFQLGVLTSENEAGRAILQMGNTNALNPADLTREEAMALSRILNYRSLTLQNAFQQYRAGLLPDDVWAQVEGRIESMWRSCYSRPAFNGVIPSFREYLQSLPSECVSNQ
tara:strand:- start:1001 stop:1483 length:483 start_codon:yes stop_codon:yes gene_type:complete